MNRIIKNTKCKLVSMNEDVLILAMNQPLQHVKAPAVLSECRTDVFL